MWSIGAMPRVSDMGERPETTKVKGVRGVLRVRRLRGVVELVTGWDSVRPACGWARLRWAFSVSLR